MRASWIVVATLLSACLQTGDVPCSDGRVCPATYTCTPMGCASVVQVKACVGIAEQEACATSAGPGRCIGGGCYISVCGNDKLEPGEVCDDGNQLGSDGCNGTCSSDESCGNGIVELAEECDSDAVTCGTTCKIVRCGNNIVEPGEFCDDGNNTNLDGCSAVCDSDETCGNGTLDFFIGEQCDDKNSRNLDGCNAKCKVEKLAWLPNDGSTDAPPMTDAAAAYDIARKRFVLFAGTVSANPSGDTWELDGSTWIKRSLAKNPPPRYSAAMAYDSKRGRMVMFGGVATAGYDNITWEYDGVTWYEVATVARPTGRQAHRMVYDSARERIVMFGGTTPTGNINDTWEYDGANWTQVIADSSGTPERRSHYGMTYDPKRGRVVMYGGAGAITSSLNDTWQYDGATWTTLSVTAPTVGRRDHTLTFDPARGQILMVGGDGALAGSGVDETWTLGSTGWTQLGGADPSRRNHVAGYDPVRRRVIIYGGINASNSYTAELTELIGSTWTPVVIAGTPPGTVQAAAAFDTTRGELVVFGGLTSYSSGSETSQTWALGDTGWRNIAPGTSPPPLNTSAMAYDAARRRIVLFGGDSAGVRQGDTWEFDGTNWLKRTPTTKPPARREHAMVYDSGRKRVVLFGGFSASNTVMDDTWEWDGAAGMWTQLNPATKPPGRFAFSMAYDSAHARTVVWGGGGGGVNNDTWLFDGTTWTSFSSVNPPWRPFTSMTYDAGRDRIVMHGGGFPGQPRDDTWELAGNAWTEYARTPTDPPIPASTFHALAYDPARSRVVLFGGVRTTTTALVYTYGLQPSLPGEVCTSGKDADGDMKVGCADDECWGVCTPLCPPGSTSASCSMLPRCGDATCDPIENCRMCPADCSLGGSACPVECGDGFCDSAESAVSCPGDCG